jgi:hypothetical protein
MRYHVLFVAASRPEPYHFSVLDADDDEHARWLLRERWPGEDDLYLVREEGLRFVPVSAVTSRVESTSRVQRPPVRD